MLTDYFSHFIVKVDLKDRLRLEKKGWLDMEEQTIFSKTPLTH